MLGKRQLQAQAQTAEDEEQAQYARQPINESRIGHEKPPAHFGTRPPPYFSSMTTP